MPINSVLSQFQSDVSFFSKQSDYAFDVYKKLIFAKKSHNALFLVIGFLLKKIRDERLYELLDYENFGQFIASEEISFSRESAFLYMRVYEFYISELGLDEEYVSTIPVSRLSLLVPVLKKMEKEKAIEFLEDKEQLRHGDFIREVKKHQNSSKPSVYWSQELDKWIVQYFDNTTILQSIGDFHDEKDEATN